MTFLVSQLMVAKPLLLFVVLSSLGFEGVSPKMKSPWLRASFWQFKNSIMETISIFFILLWCSWQISSNSFMLFINYSIYLQLCVNCPLTSLYFSLIGPSFKLILDNKIFDLSHPNLISFFILNSNGSFLSFI